MHPPDQRLPELSVSASHEACALCGYDTTRTPPGAPCPECGSTKRAQPPKSRLVADPKGLKRVLAIQAVGGGLCMLGVVVSAPSPFPSPIGTLLVIAGAILCVIIGPTRAVFDLYRNCSLAGPPIEFRRTGALLFCMLAVGVSAFVTGSLMGFAGCTLAGAVR